MIIDDAITIVIIALMITIMTTVTKKYVVAADAVIIDLTVISPAITHLNAAVTHFITATHITTVATTNYYPPYSITSSSSTTI